MGCVHSAPDRVEAATTSDELTRPTRGGPAQQDQAQDTFRRADNNNNNNLQPQNVIPVQPHAEAPSSGSLGARPPRSSSRIAAQQDGASDSLQPSLTADGAPRPLPEPPRALVSVGVPRPPRALPTASKKTVGRTAQLPPIRRLAPQPTAASATQTSPSGLPAPSGNPVDAPPPLPPPPPLQPQQPPAGEATPAQIVSALPALKDLLARISAPQPQPPQQQPVDRKLVLIVWDIENVRCPNGKDPLLTPAKVLGYVRRSVTGARVRSRAGSGGTDGAALRRASRALKHPSGSL
ncbi:hypothetical protein PLESTB_001161800 [Pleodorina starrii]|uniref:Uncharacterized protein n=1 Tax=Pleodorina starrii TaxID=330485 RepID=A0A9W6BRI1_9CHLO|nr:hypothetical protein PLESTB_001161800 [Pleodorina starrii]